MICVVVVSFGLWVVFLLISIMVGFFECSILVIGFMFIGVVVV